MDTNVLSTVAEIANHFQVSRQTIYSWVEKGCPYYTGKGKHISNVFLSVQEVEEWIKEEYNGNK